MDEKVEPVSYIKIYIQLRSEHLNNIGSVNEWQTKWMDILVDKLLDTGIDGYYQIL